MSDYEKFKLEWMIAHNKTLWQFVRELQRMVEELDDDAEVNVEKLFKEWELYYGFGGEVWPCYDEYMECEGRK